MTAEPSRQGPVFTRTTLIAGMVVGAIGTALLVPGSNAESGHLAIVPGLIVSGIGQGIDRQRGHEVIGVVQGASVSWQLGRQTGLEI